MANASEKNAMESELQRTTSATALSLGGFTKELLECEKRGEVRLLALDELY